MEEPQTEELITTNSFPKSRVLQSIGQVGRAISGAPKPLAIVTGANTGIGLHTAGPSHCQVLVKGIKIRKPDGGSNLKVGSGDLHEFYSLSSVLPPEQVSFVEVLKY